MSKKLTKWFRDSHASFRCIEGTDPSDVLNRIAFIEKTPRVRTGYDKGSNREDWKNWEEGPKGCGEECGRYKPSRDWCDERLLEMGYILPESEKK